MDLCVYNGEIVQPEMIARNVAMASVVTVATPAYLAARGTPRSVAELVAHDGVGFSSEGAPRPWTFAGGRVHAPRGPFRSHDAGQIRAAALAGLGLAHTPKWLFDDALADGRVVEVLAEFARAPGADPGQPSLLHPATADQGEGVGRLPRRDHPRPGRPALARDSRARFSGQMSPSDSIVRGHSRGMENCLVRRTD